MPVMLTTLVAAFFGALLARRGRDLERLAAEEARLERRLATLREKGAALKAQRDALLSSPEAIERVAREEYGFSAPDERVERLDVAVSERPARLRDESTGWGRWFNWGDASLLLPVSVFIITAVTFWVLNAMADEAPARNS